jgi:hypothetical protein
MKCNLFPVWEILKECIIFCSYLMRKSVMWHTRARTHTRTRAHTHAHTRTRAHTHTHTRAHTHTRTHTDRERERERERAVPNPAPLSVVIFFKVMLVGKYSNKLILTQNSLHPLCAIAVKHKETHVQWCQQTHCRTHSARTKDVKMYEIYNKYAT